MIPIHPVAGADAADLRWVVPPGTLDVTGVVRAAPEPLAGLLDDGTLAAVHVEREAVVTSLGEGLSWRRVGPAVRTALHRALEQPAGWRTDPVADSVADPMADRAEPTEPAEERPDPGRPLPCARFCPAAARGTAACSTGCAPAGQPRRMRLASPGLPKW